MLGTDSDMLPCKRCGQPLKAGKGRLCANCQKDVIAQTSKEAQVRYKQQKGSASTNDFTDPFKNIPLALGVCAFVFSVLFLVLYLMNTKAGVQLALCDSAIYTLSLVSILGWGILWTELLVENPLIAIMCAILPIGVYYLVMQHPEKTKKPFAIHSVATVIVGILWFAVRTKLAPIELPPY